MRTVDSALETLGTRRSIRDFEAGDVPDEDVRKILHAGRMAPSPGNSQPWRFHVLRGAAKKRLVEELRTNGPSPERFRQLVVSGMETVPVAIAVENPTFGLRSAIAAAGDAASSSGDGPSIGSLLGTAAAVENMLLAIHALGYGSVWLGNARILAAAKSVVDASGEIVSVLPVGHPAAVQNEYVKRARKPIEEVTRFHG